MDKTFDQASGVNCLNYQWPFQDPKSEVPTIYKAYYKAYVRGYTLKIWPYIVQYLHFRMLKFPLKLCVNMWAGIFLTLSMAMGLGRKGRYIRYLVAHIEIGGLWMFIPRKFWLMPASIWLWTIPRPSPLKKKTPYCFCSFFKNLMHFFSKQPIGQCF